MATPTELNLNSTTPAAPSGKQNCLWQADSAYTDPNTGLPLRDATVYPPSAGSGLEGAIALAGDIGGSSDTPNVIGIQGVGVSATSPTNGQVLQYDSGSGLYKPASVTGAGGATGPTPASRRWALGSSVNTNLSTAAGQWIGDTAGAAGSTISFQAAGSALFPIPVSIFTQNSSSSFASLQSNLANASTGWTVVGKNMLWVARIAISLITSIRLRVGVGQTGSASTWVGSDSLTSIAYAGFRFSTAASDTNFMCETGSGSAVNTVSSGIAPVANTLCTLQIQFNDSVPNVVFSINGAVVYTSTTDLPPSGSGLGFLMGIKPQTSVSQTMYVGWVYEEADN